MTSVIPAICLAFGQHQGYLKFKDDDLRDELYEAPILLREIACDFARLCNELGYVPTITRIRGRVDGSSGVHESNRAIDFRGEFYGRHTMPQDIREALLKFVNAKYKRMDGKKRKPTIFASEIG